MTTTTYLPQSRMASSSSNLSFTSKRRRRRRPTATGLPGTPLKSPTASPTALCFPTIAYLNQFKLSVTATKTKLNHGKDVRYHLLVTPTSDSSQQWTVSRSFKELQGHQLKLLHFMQLGHICHANCPYLYSSIKGRFPKECFLFSTSSYVMTKRTHAIEECFTTLLEALRKRENYSSCSILPGTVALEFIAFLNEDLPIDHEFRWENFVTLSKTTSSNSTWLSSDDGSRGLTPTSFSKYRQSSSGYSSDSFLSTGSSNSMLDTCGLCTSGVAAKGSLTTLSCGHKFHDECVVIKLNETLACPTCGLKL